MITNEIENEKMLNRIEDLLSKDRPTRHETAEINELLSWVKEYEKRIYG